MQRRVERQLTSGNTQCRICGYEFVAGLAEDEERHKQRHEQLKKGALPVDVREFMKDFGWAIAFNDGRVDEEGRFCPNRRWNSETGKRVVAFALWARARDNGIPESEFEEYMTAQLLHIDALASNDEIAIEFAELGVKSWDEYGG